MAKYIETGFGRIEYTGDKGEERFKLALCYLDELIRRLVPNASNASTLEESVRYIGEPSTLKRIDSNEFNFNVRLVDGFEYIPEGTYCVNRCTLSHKFLVHESMWDTVPTITTDDVLRRYELKENLKAKFAAKKKALIIKDLEEVLDRTFKRKWEITRSGSGKLTYVTIHYPEITITNEDDRSRVIKDIFIRYTFDKDMKINRSIEAYRTTYEMDEYYSDYCHSHISGRPNRWGSTFCLGSSTEVSILLKDIYELPWDKDRMEMLLNQFDSQVRWENKEDPHMLMSNITAFNPRISSIRSSSMLSTYMRFLTKFKSFPINQSEGQFHHRFYVKEHSQEFKDMLFSVAEHKGKFKQNGKFVEEVPPTKILIKWYRTKYDVRENNHSITFKGIKHHVTIAKPTIKFGESKANATNPLVTEFVVEKLNDSLNKALDNGKEQSRIQTEYSKEKRAKSRKQAGETNTRRREERERRELCWNGKTNSTSSSKEAEVARVDDVEHSDSGTIEGFTESDRAESWFAT